MPPIVPLDVVWVIIEHLFQLDPASVKTCSLVCHAFLPICRRHIFGHIRVKDDNDVRKFHQLLSDTPIIGIYIRKLNLPYEMALSTADADSKVLGKITGLRFLCIGNLVSLRSGVVTFGKLTGPPWHQYPLRWAVLHFFSLQFFTTLELNGVLDFLVADLAPCKNLNLLIRAVGFTTDIPPNIQCPPINVGKLHIENLTRSVGMHMWGAKCADGEPFMNVSSLTELSFQYDINTLQDMLDMFSHCRQLVTLELNVENCITTGLARLFTNGATPKTLKKLDIFIVYDNDRSDDPFCGLVDEIKQMNAENVIEEITIQVYILSGLDRTRHDKWGRLDEALARSEWSQLHRVSLKIVVGQDADDVAVQAFHTDFPKFPITQYPLLSSTSSLVFDFQVYPEDVWWNLSSDWEDWEDY
ncbi:hypothetical protein BDN70DRAFT_988764 [Pholiota conissans]|uniref:F-box domain-containing protein n=1 Tax=Pholiota conissans TaxID=109636 RepID=A0A9P6D769_9AGAR|nr:hypothetical protein BDN70DRAFT_988764 [Pholiota conissans]